jgi:UPF0755 protein
MRAPRILVLLGVAALAGAAGWVAYALLTPYQGFASPGVFVDIPRGTAVRGIARLLEEHGVVRSRVAFELLCRWRGRAPQAGEYRFTRAMRPAEVFETLAAGRIYVQTVVVPEGLTLMEIAELFERVGLATRDSFLAAARDAAPVRDLAPEARSLEGFLFPATYDFPRRVTPQEIVAAMVRRFREVWEEFPADGRNPHGRPAFDIVTLASLIERETSVAEERPVVAGVFYNRLRRGIALQCDPTVIYALQLANRYRGTLTTHDLEFDSPYNTYRHRGLPPGPIASPGAAALRAALFPSRVDYLYFVSNTQGGHFFSTTLAEHTANVARYRRLLGEGQRNAATGAANPAAPPKRTSSTKGPR